MQDQWRLFQGVHLLSEIVASATVLLEGSTLQHDNSNVKEATRLLYTGTTELRQLLPILRKYADSLFAGTDQLTPAAPPAVDLDARTVCTEGTFQSTKLKIRVLPHSTCTSPTPLNCDPGLRVHESGHLGMTVTHHTASRAQQPVPQCGLVFVLVISRVLQ